MTTTRDREARSAKGARVTLEKDVGIDEQVYFVVTYSRKQPKSRRTWTTPSETRAEELYALALRDRLNDPTDVNAFMDSDRLRSL